MKVNIHINDKVCKFLDAAYKGGSIVCALQGGRRAGKTYNIAIWLLLQALQGNIVVVASMTQEQGRNGAFADFKQIIANSGLSVVCQVLSSPREIRCSGGGVVIFSSFADSERAKGVACDFLFLNEANKFTYQQYVDMSVNVRKMLVLDYNPNVKFWVDKLNIKPLLLTWKDNPYLTASQRQWFADLKDKASKPTATQLDVYYYRVYYLGEYADIEGEIFNASNIVVSELPEYGLYHYAIFCDPSALRGSDFFSCVLSVLSDSDKKIYIVDWYSPNAGSRADIATKLIEWQRNYDVADTYVETNGMIGIDFFDFCRNSNMNVTGWNSKGNKFERIIANYQNLTENLVINKNIHNLQALLERIYSFSKKCEHDDDIDAINSSYIMQNFRRAQYV